MLDDSTQTTAEPAETWTPDFWAAFTVWSNEQEAQQRQESARPGPAARAQAGRGE